MSNPRTTALESHRMEGQSFLSAESAGAELCADSESSTGVLARSASAHYLFGLLKAIWASLRSDHNPGANKKQFELTRRQFLQAMSMASAGAVVAYSFPQIIVPKNIVSVSTGTSSITFPVVPTGQDVWAVFATKSPYGNMRGVPYLINNTGNYFGFTRIPRDFYSPVISKEEIAERERQWHDALPRNRSLIPEDYRRG